MRFTGTMFQGSWTCWSSSRRTLAVWAELRGAAWCGRRRTLLFATSAGPVAGGRYRPRCAFGEVPRRPRSSDSPAVQAVCYQAQAVPQERAAGRPVGETTVDLGFAGCAMLEESMLAAWHRGARQFTSVGRLWGASGRRSRPWRGFDGFVHDATEVAANWQSSRHLPMLAVARFTQTCERIGGTAGNVFAGDIGFVGLPHFVVSLGAERGPVIPYIRRLASGCAAPTGESVW